MLLGAWYKQSTLVISTSPSGHMTLIQRCLNVDATSWRCIDVEPTLYKHHVPAGLLWWITAFLEVKIWSLFKHGNVITGNKILWKRGEIALKEQILFFSTIFSMYLYIQESNYLFICEIWLFSSVLHNWYVEVRYEPSILKYSSESLGIGDNESQLYEQQRSSLDVYFSQKKVFGQKKVLDPVEALKINTKLCFEWQTPILIHKVLISHNRRRQHLKILVFLLLF